MGGGGTGATGSAALFGTLRTPIASAEALCCPLLGLDAIGRVVVEQVGVEGWTLDFCVSSFVGGFGRAVVCFITTHTELEPLVFPEILQHRKVIRYQRIPSFRVAVVVGLLVCVFERHASGSRIRLLETLLSASEPHRTWNDVVFGEPALRSTVANVHFMKSSIYLVSYHAISAVLYS
jgi:hypothetical protein